MPPSGNSAQSRQDFASAAQGRIDDLKKKLDDLAWQARNKGEEAQQYYDQQKPVIERKITDLQDRLAELRKSSGPAWEKARAGFSAAYEDLRKSLGEAADQLRSSPGTTPETPPPAAPDGAADPGDKF